MCWGMAAGQWLLKTRPGWLAWRASATRPVSGGIFERLAVLGRWSLLYYLVHQPVLIALLSAWKWCAG